LTGTDAGSNALFGNLQKVTAEQLGISPVLMASANSAGGVMGKMIDAQSIVVSSAATHQEGNEAASSKPCSNTASSWPVWSPACDVLRLCHSPSDP
jgi:L-lactate permease